MHYVAIYLLLLKQELHDENVWGIFWSLQEILHNALNIV